MEELETTIVAVRDYVPAAEAEAWFVAVSTAYDAAGEDWDTFAAGLTDQAAQASFPSAVAETFLKLIEDEIQDRWTVLRTMSEERDNLPRQYEELIDQLAAGGGRPYDEATGLYYDEAGTRYLRDSSGNDQPLQWTENELYWVNTDGEDHWYDQSFQPYGAPDSPAEAAAGGDAPGAPGTQYDEATGLYYDEAGTRYLRDSSGNDQPLQWTENELYWVNTDGEDHWYDQSFQPYGAEESPAAEMDLEVEPGAPTAESGETDEDMEQEQEQEEQEEEQRFQSEEELPPLTEEQTEEVEVVAESVFMDLEDAVRETDGVELEDLTENDINKLIEMLAGQALAEAQS